MPACGFARPTESKQSQTRASPAPSASDTLQWLAIDSRLGGSGALAGPFDRLATTCDDASRLQPSNGLGRSRRAWHPPARSGQVCCGGRGRFARRDVSELRCRASPLLRPRGRIMEFADPVRAPVLSTERVQSVGQVGLRTVQWLPFWSHRTPGGTLISLLHPGRLGGGRAFPVTR